MLRPKASWSTRPTLRPGELPKQVSQVRDTSSGNISDLCVVLPVGRNMARVSRACARFRGRRRLRPRQGTQLRAWCVLEAHVRTSEVLSNTTFGQPAAPREHCLASGAACRAWHMSTRRAEPASLPALFAGMTAAASASTARPERASVDISRWVPRFCRRVYVYFEFAKARSVLQK